MIPIRLSHPIITYLDERCLERSKSDNDCPIRLSAVGDCPRKTAALLAGGPRRPIDGRQARVFSMGNERGEMFESMVCAHDPTASRQLEVSMPLAISAARTQAIVDACAKFAPIDNARSTVWVGDNGILMVRGHLDLYVGSTNTLVDFKTTSGYGFKSKQTEGADESYVAQVRAYGAAWWMTTGKLPNLAIVYENKDDSTLGVADVPFSEALAAESVLAYGKKLDQIADSLIARDFTPAPAIYAESVLPDGGELPWQCTYCAVGPVAAACAPAGYELTQKTGRGDKTKYALVKR